MGKSDEGDEGHEGHEGHEEEDREQEYERSGQEAVLSNCRTLDAGCQEGTCSPEDQGLRCDQEGLSALHQGEGVLQELRLSCELSGAWTWYSASSRCGAFHTCRALGACIASCVAIEGTKDGILIQDVYVS